MQLRNIGYRTGSLAILAVVFVAVAVATSAKGADDVPAPTHSSQTWPQWRGPHRNGLVDGGTWPATLDDQSLQRLWSKEFGPSYSGPIVWDKFVFTTETIEQRDEAIICLDRSTGKEVWRARWPGAMAVPFFAAANGSWIRATPACDGQRVFVAGMRDVLVCLDVQKGTEQWRVDFVKKFSAPLPDFGFVSSPLVDGDDIYVQAGASVCKLDKYTGDIHWRSLKDQGGMYGSAFSSPMVAEIAGKRLLVAQTRTMLAGLDLATGEELWSQEVPAFRGMNILTPVIVGDDVFTSSYQNKSWLYGVSSSASGKFDVHEKWSAQVQGYMSTPVVVDGHAYMHLQNQRFACINLRTGDRT
ncbi:MAG: PQQ-like beta-propeller repeat protein, partial [Planctomycetales bacterium]|nr:PQQ-like beta-propeller repeat protein [Planctomycetales bacterium]